MRQEVTLSAALALFVACSPSSDQARAVTVAACVAELAATIPPDARLPDAPEDLTTEDLETAARLIEGVRECRARAR